MALRKWGRSDGKPSAIFATTHKDRIGGGELYAHQIASQINLMCDMRYFTGNTGNLHAGFEKYHGSKYRFTATALMHPTDIFISCSHFQVPEPIGKHRNIIVTFFPNPAHRDAVQKYDTIVTCSTFSAKWVRRYWGKTAKVIHPFIDVDKYRIDKQKVPKSIINVGRFFREEHGHSKRQDILIEAFADLCSKDEDWALALCGSVLSDSDSKYLEYCKGLVREKGLEDRVVFYPNVEFSDLQRLYAGAEYYWHANGYGSKTPYETEHYGIVIAEAMASGCIPVIYADGGYEDFGCAHWTAIKELANITLSLKTHKTSHTFAKANRKFVKEKFSECKMREDVQKLLFRR